jgi:hypothetical protein
VVSKPPLGSNLGVGRSYQILEIPDVFTTSGIGFAGTSGLIFAAALTLNPIEDFETTSRIIIEVTKVI